MPHSEIPGSKPARGSPGLNAACHVLHRLSTPRHPPGALLTLAPPQRQRHLGPRRRPRAVKGGERALSWNDQSIPRGGPARDAVACIPMRDPGRPRPRKEGEGTGVRQSARPPGGVPSGPDCTSPPYDFVERQLEPPPPRRHGTARPGPARAPGRRVPISFPDRAGTAGPWPAPSLGGRRRRSCWWARADLNGRPHAYQACALTS